MRLERGKRAVTVVVAALGMAAFAAPPAERAPGTARPPPTRSHGVRGTASSRRCRSRARVGSGARSAHRTRPARARTRSTASVRSRVPPGARPGGGRGALRSGARAPGSSPRREQPLGEVLPLLHELQTGLIVSSRSRVWLTSVRAPDSLSRPYSSMSSPSRLAMGLRINTPPVVRMRTTPTTIAPKSSTSSPSRVSSFPDRPYAAGHWGVSAPLRVARRPGRPVTNRLDPPAPPLR